MDCYGTTGGWNTIVYFGNGFVTCENILLNYHVLVIINA
jgi:hypothetical protein